MKVTSYSSCYLLQSRLGGEGSNKLSSDHMALDSDRPWCHEQRGLIQLKFAIHEQRGRHDDVDNALVLFQSIP